MAGTEVTTMNNKAHSLFHWPFEGKGENGNSVLSYEEDKHGTDKENNEEPDFDIMDMQTVGEEHYGQRE